MHTLAIIHWGYLALFVTVVGAVAFAPVVKALFRNARTIANTSSDKFRLNNTHIWTEAYHTDGGGSYQSMRLNDGNFVWVSIGVTTAKVSVTPDLNDTERYRELKEFQLPKAFLRAQWPPKERHADDLLLLERLRRAVAWPNSAEDLAAKLAAMDNNLLDANQSGGSSKDSGSTEMNDIVALAAGDVTIRTLSHSTLMALPHTTIFSTADPYDENAIVSFAWDTIAPITLRKAHSRLVACVQEHGFNPIKEAAVQLEGDNPTGQTAGKVKLLMLLTPEIAGHVTFVG